MHSVTDHVNIVRNGLYSSPGGGPHDKREAALAALDALVSERDEARAQLRAATDLIVTTEKIVPGITQTASAFAIGDVYEARQRAEAAEAREAQLREALETILLHTGAGNAWVEDDGCQLRRNGVQHDNCRPEIFAVARAALAASPAEGNA